MPWWLVPTAIGAAASAGSSYASGKQSRKNLERQIQANRELAAYSYDQQKQMIHQQNLYNAPASQMERYKEAGLNPNLIYSQGNPGQQTEIAKYNAPREDYKGIPPVVDVGSVLEQFQNFAMKNAQIDNVRAVTENQEIKNQIAEALKDESISGGELDLGLKRQSHQKNIEDIEIKRLLQQKVKKELTEKDYEIIYKKYRNQWMSQGITSSDNVMFRMMVRALMSSGVDIMDFMKK